MTEHDCYKILGIPPDADEQTIRKAFRTKAKEKHPDTNSASQNTTEFILLKKAMDVLLDPIQRMKHDRLFGYSEKPKNKGEHNKQQFSEFQTKKAESLVKDWSKDFDLAMRIRESERLAVINENERRKRRMILLIIVLASLVPAAYLLYYLFMNYIFIMP